MRSGLVGGTAAFAAYNPGLMSNITWHAGDITRFDRETLLKQKGCTAWFTGLSGSGKSTVAVAVEKELARQGRLCYRLDGNNLRHGLNQNLGFTPEDRAENVRRAGEVCRLMADAGVIVLASFVSPYGADRAKVRALHEAMGLPFFEVFVDVPVEVAAARDPKGLYKKAQAGGIANFTGLSQGYEAPANPELTVRTHEVSLDEGVAQVLALLRARGVLPA